MTTRENTKFKGWDLSAEAVLWRVVSGEDGPILEAATRQQVAATEPRYRPGNGPNAGKKLWQAPYDYPYVGINRGYRPTRQHAAMAYLCDKAIDLRVAEQYVQIAHEAQEQRYLLPEREERAANLKAMLRRDLGVLRQEVHDLPEGDEWLSMQESDLFPRYYHPEQYED